jgi:LacI family transcriptional regulator
LSEAPIRTRRPTRKDVAELAGVAPSTVTIVLSDRGTELRIAPATQERVQRAARELGYYPNRLIRGVLEGRTGVIGIYLRWEQWYAPFGYWTNLVWAIQKAIAQTDYQLLIHNARQDSSTEEIFARQSGGLVDGVIILNSGQDAIVDRLIEAKMPVVELGDPYSRLPFVGLNSEIGVRQAMEHFHQRGFRRPAYLGHVSGFPRNAEARRVAFMDASREIFGIGCPESRTRNLIWSDDTLEAVLSINPRPDSVLCASDNLAYDLLAHCLRRGMRVPEDIGVVGFDALSGLAHPRLMTSIEAPHEKMAELAVQKLGSILAEEPFERETVMLPTLRIGDTT